MQKRAALRVFRCAAQAVMLLAAHLPFVRAAPMSLSQLYSFVPLSFHFTMFAKSICISNQFLISHLITRIPHLVSYPASRIPYPASTTAHLVSFHSFLSSSFQQASVHTLPILLCSPCLPSPALRGYGGTKPTLIPPNKNFVLNFYFAIGGMPPFAPSLCVHHG